MNRDRYTFSDLSGSATYSLAGIADGAQETQDITVSGAAMGDFVMVSASFDVVDLQMEAHVTAADTCTVVVRNGTGGTVTPSGTLYIRILKRQ